MIKASHNKVYTSPPPIHHTPPTHTHMPNYLKHTAASLYKDEKEKDRDAENDAVAAENSHIHASSVYMTLPTHHPANASKKPRKKRPGHSAHPSTHPSHPAAAAATSPICPHYPPVIASCIWESEAHRGGRSGRKARDWLAAGSSGKNAKEKVVPF